jgi:hypothetical protein
MDWEDGYGRRPGSKEREGQRARSSGPGSSVVDEREQDKESEGVAKREAEADVEGERRAEKVRRFFLEFDEDCSDVLAQKPRLSELDASSKREDTPEEGEI